MCPAGNITRCRQRVRAPKAAPSHGAGPWWRRPRNKGRAPHRGGLDDVGNGGRNSETVQPHDKNKTRRANDGGVHAMHDSETVGGKTRRVVSGCS
jgi:hypothetical protein